MAIPTQKADDADIFFDHLAILRDYAEKIFVDGVELDYGQLAERDMPVANVMEVGQRAGLPPQERVGLLFAGLFGP